MHYDTHIHVTTTELYRSPADLESLNIKSQYCPNTVIWLDIIAADNASNWRRYPQRVLGLHSRWQCCHIEWPTMHNIQWNCWNIRLTIYVTHTWCKIGAIGDSTVKIGPLYITYIVQTPLVHFNLIRISMQLGPGIVSTLKRRGVQCRFGGVPLSILYNICLIHVHNYAHMHLPLTMVRISAHKSS